MALVSPAAQAQPPKLSTDDDNKIAAALAQDFDTQSKADFWVRFADRPDLSSAKQVSGWGPRGEAVASALQATARASQADAVEVLDKAGVEYETFWITNAIYVHDGSEKLAVQLASDHEVADLRQPTGFDLMEPTPAESERQIQALEWGIANIRADQVWDQFGVRGEEIVVANIDTGVQYDHPALVEQYRGNQGDGTFDHNYNWFDAAGECADAPCDWHGHGSHTMGTMAGDDGGSNQIGVAPKASWIAANGCCPSDAALISSGQWMLQPTDLNGDNPDASKRPHIVNNSWGTELPSNDPFMEDVLQAWAAAGMFGMWSNGNNGPGCSTSGSPGSRIINYSAGMYDINNNISSGSSRGPGQDGEVKPNISAPGVNVRSALPGSSYGNFSGTSMAAPHVAGTIALLWSAAPSLVGDPDATKDLLDASAIDTEDLQCGGTAEDNNVYGEGRLDALAAMQLAPVGDTGTLAGTVTDAATDDPISGAELTITGAVDREAVTGDDGTYETTLPVGDYSVTATAFGYETVEAQVTITADATTTQDFALSAVDSGTVSGTISDGSGHGWPLYAKVTVDGHPLSTYTDPVTGSYSLSLPVGSSYTLQVESQYPGYADASTTVDVGGDTTQDVSLVVDQCEVAPGYELSSPVFSEGFDDGQPDGWTVVDNAGSGQVWQFDDPGGRGNLTGGEGGFATVDSDSFGTGGSQDSELHTPAIDLSDVSAPTLQFRQDFRWYSLGGDEFTNVDVSVDGGATWENVFHQSGADARGPLLETVDIPQAGGESQVQLRFHYGDASFDWWWQVDDIGIVECVPTEGGLVLGHVNDTNTGDGLNGATVTSTGNPDDTGTSFATPDDPANADGFYWLFSSLTGDQEFTASSDGYQDDSQTVQVAASATNEADFALGAGQLSITPTDVSATMRLGQSADRTFTVTNTGTAPAEVELAESGGSFEMLEQPARAGVMRHSNVDSSSSGNGSRFAPSVPSLRGSEATLGTSGLKPGASATPRLEPAADGEVTITHSESQEILALNSIACVNNATGDTTENGFLRTFALDDFDIGGDFDVNRVSFGIETLSVDQAVTVNLYTLDGELVYDNMTLVGSTETTLDAQELSMVTVPVTGTVPAGATLVVEIDVPDMVGVGTFFPGSNDAGQTAPTYLRSDTCGLPEPEDAADLGFPEMHLVMNVTGEVGGDVPWLDVTPTAATLAPGDSLTVTASMDSAATEEQQPGTYTAGIQVGHDTPYQVPQVSVAMNVTPPNSWGKIGGTVTGVHCSGEEAPLSGAIVQVNGKRQQVTLITGEDGGYAYWLPVRNNPLQLIVATGAHVPQTRNSIVIPRREQVEDFRLNAIC